MSRLFNRKVLKIGTRMQFYRRTLRALKFIPPPVKTSVDETELPPPTKIDQETAEHLERLSLVGFENEESIKIVEDAIRFADRILEVDTENVQPLITVLENECLYLRDDENAKVERYDILLNSKVYIENYLVSPIGNTECTPEIKAIEDSERNISLLPDIKKICQK